MNSIFATDLSTELSMDPREIIASEITHLEGMGSSRWRSNPFMATCRLIGGVAFLVVLVLYFLDPFLYSIHKTKAINAYIYLVRFGDASEVQPLRTCGLFTARDLTQLALRAQQSESESVKDYFISTSQADQVVRDAVQYMTQVRALDSGDLTEATPLTSVRYYLFQNLGIITPHQWIALSPYIELD